MRKHGARLEIAARLCEWHATSESRIAKQHHADANDVPIFSPPMPAAPNLRYRILSLRALYDFSPGLVMQGVGLAGIWGVMLGASKRLATKQDEKYGKDKEWQAYKQQVKGTILPKF
jgi:hypothetical protein